MTKLPSLRPREVIKAFHILGFEEVRHKGGHAMIHHHDCRRAPLPIHPTKSVSPHFLADILKQLDIEEDAFLRALGRK